MYISASIKSIFDEPERFRRSAAGDPNTSPTILTQLADDSSNAVRWLLARNPSTPLTALKKLLDDPSYEVRLLAMGNPNLPDAYKMYVNLDKYDRSGEVVFEIATSNYDPAYEQGITKIFTDYITRKGYKLLSINFDTPASDYYDDDDDDGYMPDDCDITVTVSSIFDEDDIQDMLDELMEMLEHEVGLDIEDSSYTQLLNRGGRFT